ncbi:alanine--tRNA ligase [Candidatus Clavichlamydia salmonicola]|uniref:alanine--tRNA ligase n=1 Tax=Candidatus Clavichlamydia salmonicola TaxID=469812 RepID=UPI00189149CD|nr:alanine--tRNA ligase [Candidatus Clavichlamydia salmonicola]
MASTSFRRRFLEFFKNKNHTIVPSSPVLPHNDPSLLFVNAGMNQFKDFFLGKEAPLYPRACSSQKCIRVGGKHNDLENVGHTSRHLTFFEMLGNFSFGDYFKEDAIKMAWDVTCNVFEFDSDKIWISVFEEDDDSFQIWENFVPAHHIVRMGQKDNFWSMADKGPCGPCTELFYDRGPQFGQATSLDQDHEGHRFLEFWNLVFMQNNRLSSTEMINLPKKNVDTGAGLERLLSLKFGFNSVFETDIFQTIIYKIEEISGQAYSLKNQKSSPAFRVIADHVRALFFAITDGVLPSNTERGYILRKLVRRAVRYGRLLNLQKPFLHKVLPAVITAMGSDFPELKQSQDRVAQILTEEEEGFLKTLHRGKNLLNSVLVNSHNSSIISGDNAFKLKDTYGFPIEEILLIAKDNELTVDTVKFHALEKEARERSRAVKSSTKKDTSLNWDEIDEANLVSTFLGYESCSVSSKILALINDSGSCNTVMEGDLCSIVLKETPFYAEKGGQIGDCGIIKSSTSIFEVISTNSPKKDIICHKGRVLKGNFTINDAVDASINENHRHKVSCNHTATHLLHQALQETIGNEARQAGSFLDDTKIRFDFTFSRALSGKELDQIQNKVNRSIRSNKPVSISEVDLTVALADGEIKSLFGEKYGAQVRVVSMLSSKELCGGTHTNFTGNIGYFRIVKESAVSAGIRRIEAVTGLEAELEAETMKHRLQDVANLLHTPDNLIEEKIQNLLKEYKILNQQKEILLEQMIQLEVQALLPLIQMHNGIPYLTHTLPALSISLLKKYADVFSKLAPSLVLVLAAQDTNKTSVICQVSKNLIQIGLSAARLLKEISGSIEIKSGGKAEFAQGGGPATSSITHIPTLVYQWISTFIA